VFCHDLMSRLPLRSLVAFAALTAAAEEPTAQTAADSLPPIFVVHPAVRTAATPRPRAISPLLAARFTALAPRFAMASPVTGDAHLGELRAVDPLHGDVVLLPPYLVAESKLRLPTSDQVLTGTGRVAIAMKRYATELDRAMNPFTLPLVGIPIEARAMAKYHEDEWLKKRAEFDDLIGLVRATNKAAGARVQREVQKAFILDDTVAR
jgi:hypothetical protein